MSKMLSVACFPVGYGNGKAERNYIHLSIFPGDIILQFKSSVDACGLSSKVKGDRRHWLLVVTEDETNPY
ncbi:MAG: hypothetical protein V7K89_14140 [Nostoc sp.]|uniref:hypothetical protein n=1 Tax=Nostoc sp. TaxID=1180 RepID=UPI002FF44AA1